MKPKIEMTKEQAGEAIYKLLGRRVDVKFILRADYNGDYEYFIATGKEEGKFADSKFMLSYCKGTGLELDMTPGVRNVYEMLMVYPNNEVPLKPCGIRSPSGEGTIRYLPNFNDPGMTWFRIAELPSMIAHTPMTDEDMRREVAHYKSEYRWTDI